MLCAALLLAATVGHQAMTGTSDTKPVNVKFRPSQWKLTWSDEFNKGDAPDPSTWRYDVGKMYNNELQYCTDNRRENTRIEHGRLILEARKEPMGGLNYTSGRINTSGKKTFLYGRIEVRAKLPSGRGTWPAIWMLGQDIGQTGWPRCGELDIMEFVGFDPDRVHANVHVDAYNYMKGNGHGNNMAVGHLTDRFNTYAIEWYEDRIEFFFNTTRYLVYRKESNDDKVWPFSKPQFLILNLAIGGDWGGQKGVDDAMFPAKYEIEYVRYYERVK